MKKLLLVCCSFFAFHSNAQLLHGDLDNWRTYNVPTAPDTTFEAPLYWNTTDSMIFLAQGFFTDASFSRQFFQSPDAHSGSRAARLVTRRQDTLGVLPALMTNADITLDFAAFSSGDMTNALVFSGGAAVSSRIISVSAWVKYFPAGTDSCFMRVQEIKSGAAAGGGDSIIGSGVAYISELRSTYTHITAAVSYTDAVTTPDLLRVFISSSGRAPQEGSELLIDDITIYATGVEEINTPNKYTIYPVPASGYISFNSPLKGQYNISVYSVDGRSCGSYTTIPGQQVDVSALTPGLYTYTIVNDSEGVTERGTFVIVK